MSLVGSIPGLQGPQHLVSAHVYERETESVIRAVVEQIHRINKDVPVNRRRDDGTDHA